MGNDVIQEVVKYLQQNSDIEVVWLYGSHAKGSAQSHSDIDLAVAFKNFDLSSFDKRLRPKALELEISNILNVNEQQRIYSQFEFETIASKHD